MKSKRKRERPAAIVHEFDLSDPRNINHPSHREAWLNVARILGAILEREDWEERHRDEDNGAAPQTKR